MEKNIEKLILLFCLSFWPLSLFLNNTLGDFFSYIIPVFFIGLSYFLFAKNERSLLYFAPIFLIPFFEPKLALLPLLFTSVNFLLNIRDQKLYLLIAVSLFVLVFNWKAFWGQTIFKPDNDAQQVIIGKTYIYDSVILARVFQNKPRIYLDKFNNNLFSLIDPNNYFFNFHPREILIDNQNLVKFPFLSIVFALFGFYYLNKSPQSRFILSILLSAILSLSVLTIFDRNDIILWLPLSLVIILGIKKFREKLKRKPIFFLVPFLFFSFVQFLRMLIT